MTDTHQRFDFILPGSWSFVPLTHTNATDAAIARLVSESFGRRDEDARLRAELRTRFAAAANQARTAGAAQLHLCRELVPGVPLPASLTVYWPQISLRQVGEPDTVQALRKVLGAPPPGESDDELVGLASGPGLRRTRLVTGEIDSAGNATLGAGQKLTTVEADYWLATLTGRVLLLSFSCGMPLLSEQLTTLFDLIVQTVSWTEPEPQAGTAQPRNAGTHPRADRPGTST